MQAGGIIQYHQFALSPALDVLGELADTSAPSDCLGIPVPIAPDHAPMIVVRCTISVKYYVHGPAAGVQQG